MLDYKKLIEVAKQAGLEEVEIVESASKELELNFFNGALENNTVSDITKVTVKGLLNGKLGVYDLENLDTPYEEIVEVVKRNASCNNSNEISEIYEGSKEYPVIETVESDFDNYSIEEKINLLASMEKELKAKDPRIVYIPHLQYAETEDSKRILNSKGLDVCKSNKYCVLVAGVVASEGEDTQSGFKIEIKNKYSDLDVKSVIEKSVEEALSMLNAKSMDSCVCPVIIENDAMKSLFSAFSGIFAGTSALRRITPLLGKENTQIMSEKITILDAPLKKDAIMKQPFDDEGVACYDKAVVENGVFKGMLHNLKTAKAFNTVSTGNAFGRGVSGCNLHITAGNVSKEDLIKSIDKGILVSGFDGLHAGVNAISGDFSLKTVGYLIENGKITRPVTLIVVSGNFLTIMNEVEEVANDLKLDYTGIGAPSIKFKGLSVSGN